jgi:hypothetical protein
MKGLGFTAVYAEDVKGGRMDSIGFSKERGRQTNPAIHRTEGE